MSDPCCVGPSDPPASGGTQEWNAGTVAAIGQGLTIVNNGTIPTLEATGGGGGGSSPTILSTFIPGPPNHGSSQFGTVTVMQYVCPAAITLTAASHISNVTAGTPPASNFFNFAISVVGGAYVGNFTLPPGYKQAGINLATDPTVLTKGSIINIGINNPMDDNAIQDVGIVLGG